MKTISVLLGLAALLFADLVLAANAVATSVTGAVQVQTGANAPRTLRQGDEVQQGDTLVTGPASSLVLKFDDGQVAALTANSRMTITAYQYNPASESGNVLLSLVSGGMRAITGLIGRRTPNQVTYRAATATIGIRGTDVVLATANGEVLASVLTGSIAFTWEGVTFTITAGEAILARPGLPVVRGTLADALKNAPPAIRQAVDMSSVLIAAIRDANAGFARQGGQGDQNNQGDNNQGNQGGGGGQQGGGNGGGSGGGGGNPSPH